LAWPGLAIGLVRAGARSRILSAGLSDDQGNTQNRPCASAPLATIARTIQRIGYECGSVISASSIDGADGAFKITCSSGDAYRAALVGGRYHFRRWGSH